TSHVCDRGPHRPRCISVLNYCLKRNCVLAAIPFHHTEKTVSTGDRKDRVFLRLVLASQGTAGVRRVRVVVRPCCVCRDVVHVSRTPCTAPVNSRPVTHPNSLPCESLIRCLLEPQGWFTVASVLEVRHLVGIDGLGCLGAQVSLQSLA